MSALDFAAIPGYAEACAHEQAARDLAFLDFPVPLCGITARQFCLRHLLLLGQCESPIVCGGEIGFADIALFLWFVSTDYCLDKKREELFVRALRFMPKDALREIDAYLDRAFMDRPANSGRGGKAYTSMAAGYVDVIASEYHWPDTAIMEMPIARLHQYIRTIMHRYNPRLPLINRSEAKVGEWLRARNGMN